jgi:hypothetical protein
VVAEASDSDGVAAAAGIRSTVTELSEVYVIEAIVALYAELRAISLSHLPHLCQREVPILIARPGENAAACVTQSPVGRRRQNTTVLDETGATDIPERKSIVRSPGRPSGVYCCPLVLPVKIRRSLP